MKALLAALVFWWPLAAWAAPFELEVQGHIDHTNDATHSVYRISEAQLLAMPAHSITTSTVWTPRSTFTGPLLKDVLKLAGAHGERMELRALDDYSVTIPVGEALHYGAILAYSMNGRRLKVRDFGPLFLVYPRDAYPSELSGPEADARFVWQVKALVLQ
jgi:hypothetical protein